MADGRQQGALARYAPRMSAVADDRVRLAEQPFPGQMGLRVAPGSAAAGRVGEALGAPLPETPNTVAEAGRRHVMWLGPDEWLVVEPAGAEGGTEAMLAAALAGEGAAVDLSANRTALILSGPDARAVLAGCCPLDLHPSAFPAGRCGQTLLARAQVIIQGPASRPRTALRRSTRSTSGRHSPPMWRSGCSTASRAWPSTGTTGSDPVVPVGSELAVGIDLVGALRLGGGRLLVPVGDLSLRLGDAARLLGLGPGLLGGLAARVRLLAVVGRQRPARLQVA